MRERPSRTPDADYSLWEEQCEQLRQQLASSTSLSTSLLRNQQTLLSMLQNQTDSFGPIGGSGIFNKVIVIHSITWGLLGIVTKTDLHRIYLKNVLLVN